MPASPTTPFDPYLRRWHLKPDGTSIHTHSSDLLPVICAGRAAMLKVARSSEEETGNRVMVWLVGEGAAQVYQQDREAIVLERLDAVPSLTDMVRAGQDDDATRILCAAAETLHQPRPKPGPEVPTLQAWFRALEARARQGGLLATTWEIARDLLAEPQEVRLLHGDIHHANLMHSAGRGWLFIDPKGLLGERGYDYANIFCNPDNAVARQPGRLARQARLIAELAGLERSRLLRWVAAYTGLSAAWWLEDGHAAEAQATLEITQAALAELHRP